MVNRSNLCKDSEQSADHILIHCAKTRELWTFLLALFGFVWEVSFYNGKLRGFKRKKKEQFGIWLPFAYFGVFGRSAIKGPSKMKSFPTKD